MYMYSSVYIRVHAYDNNYSYRMWGIKRGFTEISLKGL